MVRADHVNRLIAGACMVMAPVLLLVAAIVLPALHTGEADQLASIADNPDRWLISSLFVFGSIVLAVPAVLGLAHMLRGRQPWLAAIGAGVAVLGLLASAGAVAIGLVSWQMTQGGTAAEMTALLERVNDTAGIWIPFTLCGFGVGIGFLLLAGGLALERFASPLVALLIAAGGVLATIGFPLASTVLVLLGAIGLVAGLGVTGLMVLSESDEEWQHTRQFRGFRPAAGAS